MPTIQHFNCCSGDVEPNWREFSSVEVRRCVTVVHRNHLGTEVETHTESYPAGIVIPTHPQWGQVTESFWGVYGRRRNNELEAITDLPLQARYEDAYEVAKLYHDKLTRFRRDRPHVRS